MVHAQLHPRNAQESHMFAWGNFERAGKEFCHLARGTTFVAFDFADSRYRAADTRGQFFLRKVEGAPALANPQTE